MIKLLRGLCFGISLRPPLTPPSADGENANAQAAAVACAPATGDVEFGISKYKLQKTINLAPNKSQQSNFNNQTAPWFELWNLEFIWDLGFGISELLTLRKVIVAFLDFSFKICKANFFSRNDKNHDDDGGGGIGRFAPDPASPSLARQPCHFERSEKSHKYHHKLENTKYNL